MNDFGLLWDFWAMHEDRILASPANEFAVMPWEWEDFIRLTPIEAWLWEDICRAQVVLYPQYPVGKYFVDFANPVAKLAIECDGKEFHTDKEKDRRRDAEIEDMGWRIFHLTGSDCHSENDEERGYVARGLQFLEAASQYFPIKRTYKPEPTGETLRRIKVNQELMAQRMKETA